VPGIVLAWMVGEGIIIYRSVSKNHAPPMPGALLATSGLFVMLALLAEAPQARFLAGALAWGFDAAALLNLLPEAFPGPQNATNPKVKTAPKGQTA